VFSLVLFVNPTSCLCLSLNVERNQTSQGRLPIRVELAPLSVDDLYRILWETKHNLVTQQIELLRTGEVCFRL
jgi:ATP-dependent protease HslVU (ClpYQ) ATPase subunit